MEATYVDHVIFHFTERRIVVVDNEGYDEEVKFKWDKEGAEGFVETVNSIIESLPPEQITYSF
ncbi:hypothetical protein SSZBM1_60 [Synechococcus phage S-SZBM1]|uniref:Uncharacterized protein n=1 Tax=Synechococcus phage S-SZBM1 TaxID=2926475 RepID=A0AC61TSG2_9CAUD|nr:hypothetical protein PP650_gp216 [Synechococcus phage S-SZBM1]UNH61177.1 hypothetical protein SSZBM1_60 [Synechococcus phage S-SZBM1]